MSLIKESKSKTPKEIVREDFLDYNLDLVCVWIDTTHDCNKLDVQEYGW